MTGPPNGVSGRLLAVTIAALISWAAVFTVIVRRQGLSGALAFADALVVITVLLAQRHLIAAALVADGTSWTIMLASTAVFIPQLIMRKPAASLPITASVAAAYWLSEPVPTSGPAILLLQGAVTCALMMLVRRGGHSADAAIALSAAAEREEQVQSARRADEREQYRRLHDTILGTLTVVASGAVSGASPTVRREAARDLAVLAHLADLPPGERAPDLDLDLDERLSGVAAGAGVAVTFTASQVSVPAVVADCIAGGVTEALANVRRHARTPEAAVQVAGDGGRVVVTIRDRGPGFDLAAVPASRRGIRESITARMASAGGAAEVTSSPGSGTLVTLWWPR